MTTNDDFKQFSDSLAGRAEKAFIFNAIDLTHLIQRYIDPVFFIVPELADHIHQPVTESGFGGAGAR